MRGFTLVEAVVALFLVSVTALALTQCLLTAQRAQRESGRWMRAVALAEQAIEQARAAGSDGGDALGGYERRWISADAGPGLRRVEAEVTWDSHRFHLQTLVAD
jgi:type II secretory pathway pseudopilin PulG